MSDAAGDALPPRIRYVLRSPAPEVATSPYISVAEDIEWLRDTWLLGETPPSPDLRRGSGALRRLLMEGLLTEAWHRQGFAGGPLIVGPDLLGLMAANGLELRDTLTAVAGGAERGDLSSVAIGAWKIRNWSTAVGPEADEGFAVLSSSLTRHTLGSRTPGEFDALIDTKWRIGAYLKAAGAVRSGIVISRGEIIQYFALHAGGVHLDRVKKRSPRRHVTFALLEELERKASTFDLNGVYFELLSIGQAVARSEDLLRLASAIRGAPA